MGRERNGSIKFDEARNVFVYRVTYLNEQGKRRDLRRQAKDEITAKRERKRLLRTLDDHGGRLVDASRMTFNTLADVYTEKRLVAPVYKAGTRIAGLRSWKKQLSFLKPLRSYFGKQRIQTITHSDL